MLFAYGAVSAPVPQFREFRVSSHLKRTVVAIRRWLPMTRNDILKISASLCERGLLKCISVDDTAPRYELTPKGWMALMFTEVAHDP